MAADLFETYAVTIIASMLLGALSFNAVDMDTVLYPLVIVGFSIIATIIGCAFVRTRTGKTIMNALMRGLIVAEVISLICFYPITVWMLGDVSIHNPELSVMRVYGSAVVGLVLTYLMVYITKYYTAMEHSPVRQVAEASTTGHATNIIAGIAISFKATGWPVAAICASIFASYWLAGLYGIAIAATAMLSTFLLILLGVRAGKREEKK